MTHAGDTRPQPDPPAPSAPPAGAAAPPPLETPLEPVQIVRALEQAARRGHLPGLITAPGAAPGGPLFSVQDFGAPFESIMSATAHAAPGGGTRLQWSMRLKRRLPAVFLIVLISTVWPGWWLTDSLLRTYFTAYDYTTWMWYVPLTAPFVPFAMWTAVKRSRASARTEADRLIARVRDALSQPTPDAAVSPPTPPASSRV